MNQTELVSASPETQQLLDLCLAICKGQRNYLTVLREKATFRLGELARAVDHFFGQVEGQGEEYSARYQAELEEVSSRFREYEAVLQAMVACVDSGAPPEALRQHAEALCQASHFLRVAVGRYEQADLAEGPSGFPLVNILDNLARRYRDGYGEEVWTATCGRYLEYYQKMLSEIVVSAQRAGPGVPERQQAVTTIVGLMGQFCQVKGHEPEARFAGLLTELTAALLNLQESFNTYNEAILTSEPTRSPQVNLVLNTVAGFRAGNYTVEVTRQAVEGYLEIVREGIKELQPALQNPSDSALLTESAATLLEAMESVEDALLVLLELTQNPALDPARVEDALARLRESGDRGATVAADVQAFNETAGKVACIHCSTMNPMEARVCSNCARPMPLAKFGGQATMEVREGGVRSGGPDFSQQQVMTDVLKALFDQCEAYEKGQLDAQILVQTLDAREAEIRRAEEKLSALRSPEIPEEAEGEERAISEEFVRMADDALDMLQVGLGQCQEGVDKIRQALETGDLDLMDEGREFYFEGCQKMWEVWRLDNALDDYLSQDEFSASG